MLKTYRKTSGNDENLVKAERLNLNETVEETLKKYPELEFGVVDVKPYPDGPFEVLGFYLGNEVVTKSTWFVTDEGELAINIGDWIATGVNDEHWPIADDIFRKTYEEVE